mmetsp:Transcript_2762/g.6458  ORF Transcript_2762/g.6458 Transcript_2762/m.6458 type:complete len:798 (-) Transcript_2762:139-2532(-)
MARNSRSARSSKAAEETADDDRERLEEGAGDGMEVESGMNVANMLKPIQDMAKNWNIDIASELMNYLEDLEHIRINFEGGDVGLNFAEAALVIQNSSLVYSKKVEYLYKLVFQTLDLLCDARDEDEIEGAEGNGKKRRKPRKSLADFAVEEREQFLLLDDVIPVAANTLLNPEEVRANRNHGLRDRVPIALLAGRAGLGDRNAAFNMMSCSLDASGAFILEKGRHKHNEDNAGVHNEDDDDDGITKAHKSADDDDEVPYFFNEELEDNNDDIHDDNMDGFASPSQQETALGLRPGAQPPSSAELLRKHNAHTEDGDLLLDNEGNDEDDDDNDSEAADPWARLDPHKEGRARDNRPLKPGKTWKVPASLRKDAEASKAATLDRTYCDLLFSVAVNPRLAARLPLRSDMVLFPEFRAYASERRRMVRENQRARKAAAAATNKNSVTGDRGDDEDDDFEHAQDVEDEEEAAAMHLAFDNVADGDFEEADQADNNDDDMYHGGGDLDFGAHSDDENEPFGGAYSSGALHLDETALQSSAPDSYVDMVRAHLQRYMESANEWASESKLHARVRQWEDKIEPFLEAQADRPPFDIHAYGERLLNGFEVNIDDDEEEGQDNEDARKLPEELSFEELSSRLGALSTSDAHEKEQERKTASATFEEAEEGIQQFEVCRAFLASLQLANNGNVELVHETNNSALRIRMLDHVLANKKLETYRAPSIRTIEGEGERVELDDDEEDEESNNGDDLESNSEASTGDLDAQERDYEDAADDDMPARATKKVKTASSSPSAQRNRASRRQQI